MMTWVHQLLVQRQREGGLNMPTPILQRSYSLLSEGLAGWQQALKVANTPFPWPWWVQLCS